MLIGNSNDAFRLHWRTRREKQLLQSDCSFSTRYVIRSQSEVSQAYFEGKTRQNEEKRRKETKRTLESTADVTVQDQSQPIESSRVDKPADTDDEVQVISKEPITTPSPAVPNKMKRVREKAPATPAPPKKSPKTPGKSNSPAVLETDVMTRRYSQSVLQEEPHTFDNQAVREQSR